MPRLVDTVPTTLPPAEAFRRASDVCSWSTWDPGVFRVSRLSSHDGEDARYRVWVWAGPFPIPMTYRVLVLIEGERIVLEGVGGTLRAVDDIRVTATPTGAEVRWQADLSLRGPLSLTEPLLGAVFDQVAIKAMAGLARHLGG